jgi:hypothetical protein
MVNRKPILTQAMHLMDHTDQVMNQAKGVAQTCYEAQGLPQHAQQVVASAEAMKNKVKISSTVQTKPSSPGLPKKTSSEGWSWRDAALMLCGAILANFPLLSMLIFGTSGSPATAVPGQEEVINMRFMAAHLSTEDLASLAKGVQPDNVSSNEDRGMTPKDYADIQKLGLLTVIDREGRPELHWSGVSNPVCHLLVKDIYAHPSNSNVEVTVNGQSVGVSCAKAANAIVLAPKL